MNSLQVTFFLAWGFIYRLSTLKLETNRDENRLITIFVIGPSMKSRKY
jgi:hypothetical protein